MKPIPLAHMKPIPQHISDYENKINGEENKKK
jgi:hypothetical protein